jgi:integrase
MRDEEAAIERELANVGPTHVTLIRDYLDERAANGIKSGTLRLDAAHIADWAGSLCDRSFADAAREDVRKFISSRGRSGAKLSTSALNLRKITVRSFQRWIRGGGKKDDYPPEVAWLETVKEQDEDRILEEVFTRDELAGLIGAVSHSQDRALLATLYDCGMRASEFLSLRIRDVAIDEYGIVLRLQKGAKGLKTGARHVRIIHAVPYLLRWLNDHPLRNNSDAPLWISRSPRSFHKRLSRSGLDRKLKTATDLAKLGRTIWAHLFRHSRATEAAKEGWSEAMMRIFFGWSRKSDMPTRYIHLAGRDVDEGILRRAGKLGETRLVESPIKARKCVCGHENPSIADFCEAPGCSRPLTVKAAEMQRQNTVQSVLEELKKTGAFASFANAQLAQAMGA